MKNRVKRSLIASLLAFVIAAIPFAGCAPTGEEQKKETISVYLFSHDLYNKGYAEYVQSRLPEVNIEFVVGQNDIDFYKFMDENGALPDVITCRRFSLHDAAELAPKLMNVAETREASAICEAYLRSFRNADSTVNWLPLCGEVDGMIANRTLFKRHDIAIPTDYTSFVSACQAFNRIGNENRDESGNVSVRGYVGDFTNDYTCLAVLQGTSVSELNSLNGQIWRTSYESPEDELSGLDEEVWPTAFENMAKFIDDVGVLPSDTYLDESPVKQQFSSGKAAIIRGTSATAIYFTETLGMDAVFLPYFGQDGENWLLTNPYMYVALSKQPEGNANRAKQAKKVLEVMLSADAQKILAKGGDVVSYSQDVEIQMSEKLSNIQEQIDGNHLYVRVASNDFFYASRTVVRKMIREANYTTEQAYAEFDTLLKKGKTPAASLFRLDETIPARFNEDGGNASYSAMANTMRELYGSDVFIAPAVSFTGLTIAGEYSERLVNQMVMPNALFAYHTKENGEPKRISGAMVKELLELFVSTGEMLYKPFNGASLPVVSGLEMEVSLSGNGYVIKSVTRNGVPLADDEMLSVTVASVDLAMQRFTNNNASEHNKSFGFVRDVHVKNRLLAYIKEVGKEEARLQAPTNYIKVV